MQQKVSMSDIPISEKPSILIIEDSIDLVELLKRRFESEHNLYYTQDGSEGIRLSKELKPDIVLLDVNLPSVNGFEVLKEIRAADSAREIVVLMITGLSDPDNIVKALSMGADDYIIKPFNLMELSARIKSHLTIKHLQKQVVGVERLNILREVAVSFNHEINNPLMSISTFASFLKRDTKGLSEEARMSVDGILDEVGRIAGIVKKLSAATRAASIEYGPGINMIDFEHLTDD
jgi:response regulator RpfG family c-di-GMP phosphodiesterase